MRERFESIYATNAWEFGSGEGSLAIHNQGYIRFLQGFLSEKNIKSVVDLGCGDWQFSQHVNWGGANYTGFDIVRSVVEANQKRFAKQGVRFEHFDGKFENLPSADLLIVKDVLQHWSFETIASFLPVLQRYRLALITNCCNPRGATVNVDISDGDFRYLDIREQPFAVSARELYSFTNRRSIFQWLSKAPRWRKRVLLVNQQRS